MRIKYISFIENGFLANSKVFGEITKAVSKATQTPVEKFEFCSDQNKMAVTLEKSLEEANVVIMCVDVSVYIRTKGLLCKMMGLKCERNRTILQMLDSDACSAVLNQNQRDAQAAIPIGAKAFVTFDGLFSGFALKADNQRLIVLPADERRIDARLLIEICDYLAKDKQKFTFIHNEEPTAKAVEKTEETFVSAAVEAGIINQAETAAEEAAKTVAAATEPEFIPEAVIEDIPKEEPEEEEEHFVTAAEAEELFPTEDVKEEAPAEEVPTEEGKDLFIKDFENRYLENEEETAEEAVKVEELTTENEADDGIEILSGEVAKKIGSDEGVIGETLRNMLTSGLKVALSLQLSNTAVTEHINSLPELAGNPNYAIVPDEKQYNISTEKECKEAVSEAARSAMGKAKSVVGMALSDIYASDDGKNFIFAALCDSKKTNVYKIFAIDGEEPSELIEIAFNSIFELLNSRIKDFIGKEAAEKNKSSKGMSTAAKITIWVVIMLVLITILGISIKSYFAQEGFFYDLIESLVQKFFGGA